MLPDGKKILTNDTTVVIQRLKSRPDENGKVGKIAGYDAEKGRYYVTGVDGVEGSLALKATNLVQRMRVLYEGKQCEVIDSDEATGQFTLQESGGASSSSSAGADATAPAAAIANKIEGVAPASLKFDTDSMVRVHGLQSETGRLMNGSYGKVTEYDEGTGRYMIDFGAKQLKIQPKNLVV